MLRINKTASERPPVKSPTNENVWRGYANLGMKMADQQGQMPTILGRDFLDNRALQTGGVPMAVSDENVAHPNGAMP